MFTKILNSIDLKSFKMVIQKSFYGLRVADVVVFAVFFMFFITVPATAASPTSVFDILTDGQVKVHYIVKSSDSILIIARKFNVLERQLMEENDLTSIKEIYAGRDLVIPDSLQQEYEGVASWYGPGFHGRTMANGDIYDQNVISVAHRTLPLGQKVKITNLKNGKSIVAPVLDRGPYIYKSGIYTRDIDLSYATAKALGTVGAGLTKVKIKIIEL